MAGAILVCRSAGVSEGDTSAHGTAQWALDRIASHSANGWRPSQSARSVDRCPPPIPSSRSPTIFAARAFGISVPRRTGRLILITFPISIPRQRSWPLCLVGFSFCRCVWRLFWSSCPQARRPNSTTAGRAFNLFCPGPAYFFPPAAHPRHLLSSRPPWKAFVARHVEVRVLVESHNTTVRRDMSTLSAFATV